MPMLLCRPKSGSRYWLATLCALSLSACGPTPTSEPNPTSAPGASGTPGPQASAAAGLESGELSLHLQADAALQAFVAQQAADFPLCLGRISRVGISLSLAGEVSASARAALQAAGAIFSAGNGRELSLARDLDLAALLAGVDFRLPALPARAIEGRLSFFDSSGANLGFVSFRAEPGGRRIGVTLAPAGEVWPEQACPNLSATVSGATFLGTGGELIGTPPSPGPTAASAAPGTSPTPSPVASPIPGPSPVPANPPGLPLNPRLVEQTSTSLTLQWDFPADARSFRLWLDGVQVASDYVTPNYYRFEGLLPSTGYRLGVSSVNAAGESTVVTVAAETLSQGHSGSGSFSGGGSSRRPSPSPSAVPAPFTGEFHANTTIEFNDLKPDVAMDADGDFVVVWDKESYEDAGYEVLGQRYDRYASRVGSEFSINTFTTGHQEDPAVAMDADGSFVVVYESYDGGTGPGVAGQRYDSDGSPIGSEFRVNTYTIGNQHKPHVALQPNGEFVVVWEGLDGSNTGIFGQRFNSTGAKIGTTEFLVNTFTSSFQRAPDVASDSQGNFTVVWASLDPDEGNDGNVILGQQFNSSGTPVGATEFRVDTSGF
ncbi:MAG TPA: hypothetical protein V6D23_12135, partial [Candidatus Obscuribacterales bacterium]